MENESKRNMREYSRVDAFIPLKIRMVPDDRREELHSRTSRECFPTIFQPLPEIEDSSLAESLRILNSKLDAILHCLTFSNGDPAALRGRQVNISGSGIGFTSGEVYELGKTIEIIFMLPTVSSCVFYVYGEVVKQQQETDGQYRTAVRFTVIDEDIREEIAKFVFEKQRETLRKQRRF